MAQKEAEERRRGKWEVPVDKLPIPYFYLKSILTLQSNKQVILVWVTFLTMPPRFNGGCRLVILTTSLPLNCSQFHLGGRTYTLNEDINTRSA